jgi:hypothetical protein
MVSGTMSMITAIAFLASLSILFVVTFIDSEWMGNVEPYRAHVAIGCFVGSVASGHGLFDLLRPILAFFSVR